MRYCDRKGTPVTTAEWQRLSRDPKYCRIGKGSRKTGANACHYETAWLGVAPDSEGARPKLFVTTVWPITADDAKKAEHPDTRYIWHETEKEAREYFDGLVAMAG